MNSSSTAFEIRALSSSDLGRLKEVFNDCFSQSQKNQGVLRAGQLVDSWPDQYARVIFIEREPVGFTMATRIPGLERYYELTGCIKPDMRNRGAGSLLLKMALNELASRGVNMVTSIVRDAEDLGSIFLRNRGFTIEHQEWHMELDDIHSPALELGLAGGYHIAHYSKREAIQNFLALYKKIFKDFAWYQPYENERQAAADLADPADLLFLSREQINIGFCWIRRVKNRVGVIEPFGIEAQYRGKGLGLGLLHQGIQRLRQQGVERVRLGAWSENEAAIRLYHKGGFQRREIVTHLGIRPKLESSAAS